MGIQFFLGTRGAGLIPPDKLEIKTQPAGIQMQAIVEPSTAVVQAQPPAIAVGTIVSAQPAAVASQEQQFQQQQFQQPQFQQPQFQQQQFQQQQFQQQQFQQPQFQQQQPTNDGDGHQQASKQPTSQGVSEACMEKLKANGFDSVAALRESGFTKEDLMEMGIPLVDRRILLGNITSP